jgi:ABC-type multidrug transport system fused ATPase/permease subunit
MAGYRRLLRLDYARHISKHSSRYSKIVDDADTSTWEMTNWWLGRFSSAILGFCGMLLIAFSISWQMTLIAISVIPPTLWFIVRHVKRYEDEQRRVNRLWEKKHEHLSDQVTNIVTYKLNPYEDIFLERQEVFSDRATAAQLSLNRRWRLVEMLNPDAFARFLVLGTGIFFVQNGTITLGTLFMFMGLLNEILTPLHLMSDILPQYSRHARRIERLLSLFAQEDAVRDPSAPVSVSQIQGAIEFRDVSFAYRGHEERSDDDEDDDENEEASTVDVPPEGFAIRNLSFAIKPGQTVALVGHSGSGKTTIMTLLSRLVDPSGGAILIDGVDMRSYDQGTIKRYVGAVLQENAMYNESVAANIAYGDPHASRDAIINAARQAHADEFIMKLPRGYDTLIGERGVRLSGGEKQRIAIARAILKNPRIVILDEPTSALDSITEKKVQQGINELVKGRTTLIIAHRLSTVQHADTILVLEQGRIIGQGSHRELMVSCPTYKTMVDLQVEGFLADHA